MATSVMPAPIRPAASVNACCDEPHCASTVVAGTCGTPSASQAVRVTLKDCSPTSVTVPPITWPTTAGSTPSRTARCAAPSSRAG